MILNVDISKIKTSETLHNHEFRVSAQTDFAARTTALRLMVRRHIKSNAGPMEIFATAGIKLSQRSDLTFILNARCSVVPSTKAEFTVRGVKIDNNGKLTEGTLKMAIITKLVQQRDLSVQKHY